MSKTEKTEEEKFSAEQEEKTIEKNNETENTLQKRILLLEHKLYSKAIYLIFK